MVIFGAVFHAWFTLTDAILIFLLGVVVGFFVRGDRK